MMRQLFVNFHVSMSPINPTPRANFSSVVVSDIHQTPMNNVSIGVNFIFDLSEQKFGLSIPQYVEASPFPHRNNAINRDSPRVGLQGWHVAIQLILPFTKRFPFALCDQERVLKVGADGLRNPLIGVSINETASNVILEAMHISI